ncbi:hypothetical protein DPMN_193007 [Dreissena polymorpha]|uniref:Secreted protein n=1 Tax=Dreissena polymorpha TaxID=45954 RepID=A0A9D3Y3X8_DREPO|nr:hypothetical protein DPMN_193007 [Dreissena polymorpha]
MVKRAFRRLLSRVACSDLLASVTAMPLCIDCLQVRVSQMSVAMPQALKFLLHASLSPRVACQFQAGPYDVLLVGLHPLFGARDQVIAVDVELEGHRM